jgi:tRNA pseudouridine13 synthase
MEDFTVKHYTIKQGPDDFIVREKSNVKTFAKKSRSSKPSKPSKFSKQSGHLSRQGSYLYYLMKKRDYSTIDVLKRIAEFLRVPLKDLGFAGTKDKRAITEQAISIRDTNHSVESRLKGFGAKDISLTLLGKGDSPISLGDLEGNEFQIIVRGADKAPKKLKRFINFYGEQRFSKNNSDVGRFIIKADFRRAAELIEDPAVKEFLEKNPGNHVGAIKTLPKKILMLYIHSYQSFIWNKTAEELMKIKGFGKKNAKNIKVPVVGFGTELRNDAVRKIVKSILQEEGISERDFIFRQMPELSSEGTERELFTDVKGLKIKKMDNKTYSLKFFLNKGCYATELIRQMFE